MLRAAYSDPLWAKMVRCCGRQGVFFDLDHSGTEAQVFVVEKLRGDWYRRDLAAVSGPSPFAVVLAIAFENNVADAELFTLYQERILALTDEVSSAVRQFVGSVDKATYEIEDLIASVRA